MASRIYPAAKRDAALGPAWNGGAFILVANTYFYSNLHEDTDDIQAHFVGSGQSLAGTELAGWDAGNSRIELYCQDSALTWSPGPVGGQTVNAILIYRSNTPWIYHQIDEFTVNGQDIIINVPSSTAFPGYYTLGYV